MLTGLPSAPTLYAWACAVLLSLVVLGAGRLLGEGGPAAEA